eukprot:IDg6208t1
MSCSFRVVHSVREARTVLLQAGRLVKCNRRTGRHFFLVLLFEVGKIRVVCILSIHPHPGILRCQELHQVQRAKSILLIRSPERTGALQAEFIGSSRQLG